MAERHAGFRLAVGVLAAVILFIEVQALVHSLQYQTSLQRRARDQARQGFLAVRPQLEAVMQTGGPAGWNDAARVVLEAGLATEVDFFDSAGERLLSLPSSTPTTHWPPDEVLAGLRPGGPILVEGPFVRPAPRVLTYASLQSGGTRVLMRVSASASSLVEDLRERRPLLVGHGLAIGLLALLGGLALLPARGGDAAARPPALGAYEAAMERLRDQGEARIRAHEAEKRRMEELVRDKEAMARAGELTAGIVHEVRNGLGTIVGYARLLQKRASAEEAEAARGILEECQTLETVARRFMDFVRDETLNLAPLDIERLLARVVARESRSHPGGEVRLDGLDRLPSLVGDEEMLERAFENVIRNAREATGPEGHVVVAGRVLEDGRLCVSVIDDGPGLAPEARVPRPFYSTKPGGLGLGLPMAVKIVRLHSGDLTLQDPGSRGLEVRVMLPPEGPPR